MGSYFRFILSEFVPLRNGKWVETSGRSSGTTHSPACNRYLLDNSYVGISNWRHFCNWDLRRWQTDRDRWRDWTWTVLSSIWIKNSFRATKLHMSCHAACCDMSLRHDIVVFIFPDIWGKSDMSMWYVATCHVTRHWDPILEKTRHGQVQL